MTGAFKKIFVVCPRGVRTGGPEALHQLVSTLRELGQEAFLTPRPGTEYAATIDAYDHYAAPWTSTIEDVSGNAVVTSEYVMPYLGTFKHAERFCWWLSIDNSPMFKEQRRAHDFWVSERERVSQQTKLRLLGRLKSARRYANGEAKLMRSVKHLSQSHYAWAFLYSHLNLLSTVLSDFTPLEVIRSVPQIPSADRGRTIAYNPKKAATITDQLRQSYPTAEFIPLAGMTGQQVIEVLASTAVYLDLGYHPGKDRMPREAAMAGAISLVARRGSGAYTADVPIPWEHKISPEGDVLKNARDALERTFDDLEGNYARQDHYRTVIAGERDNFRHEVKAAFIDLHLESDVASA
ncbi:hypothetical protein [Cryobacterium sp. TMT4-31]|uniref:hypothetical protein n=1 Tax=Cryobacterium sp. TMT4-31 TaxID=1259259 RepID=UPI00106DAA3D|nr:hypothetical protein [Cryobacterium sp. TMT4-31]TFC89876.1 hypothetical protein E3T19_07225 [Cryobacterium sp. TMT4-31]